MNQVWITLDDQYLLSMLGLDPGLTIQDVLVAWQSPGRVKISCLLEGPALPDQFAWSPDRPIAHGEVFCRFVVQGEVR